MEKITHINYHNRKCSFPLAVNAVYFMTLKGAYIGANQSVKDSTLKY